MSEMSIESEKVLKKLFNVQHLVSIVKNTLMKDDFKIVTVSIQPASSEKLGFLGDHFKLVIQIEQAGQCNAFSYFIKALPLCNEEQANYIKEYKLMKREIIAYNLLQSFDKFIGDTKWLAKFYLANESALVFEDLNLKGFQAENPRDFFTKQHCKAALAAIANFHAFSIIYEEMLSIKLRTNIRLENEYKDIFDVAAYKFDGWYTTGMNAMLSAVEHFSRYGKNADVLQAVRENWSQLWKDALKLGDPSGEFRNILCHRDLWASNLLFHFNSDGIPDQCVIVDLQAVRSMPPAADVMALLYLNTTRKDRDSWMPELQEYYYFKLENLLSKNQYNIDKLITKHEFIRQCDVYKKFGLMMCGSLLQLTSIGKKYKDYMFSSNNIYKHILTVDRTDLILQSLNEDEYYRQRIIENMEEFVELYILK